MLLAQVSSGLLPEHDVKKVRVARRETEENAERLAPEQSTKA